ncbi:hypothetical protein [Novosphingobium olei]|uniref:Bacteriophage replication gene A protein n=1 Tax=Novosphingobium olei TaxID=2728851 RepID=A0A7Y0BR88_9SPHN|nr:hypothetical protein [Novosphingobium olei]NML94968.1 hypothetical protein [Novosphingobium olei]
MATAVASRIPRARDGSALKLHRDCGFGGVSIAPLHPQSPANPPVARTGTALAINYLTSGVAALSASTNGRGGARNRADRESHALTAAQIGNLKAAERHAEKIGLPFTRMISIHWQAAGVPLAGMAKATYRFTDLLTKALARHGSRTAWLWTHENVPGNTHDKGGHCHLLIHVPADLVPIVTALQRGWLRRITGQPYRARVIHSKPIGGRLGLETGNPDLHAINLGAALTYVLKGASHDAAQQFNLERLEPGGRVIGKRCGTSQNIGAKARKTKG